MTAYNQDQKIMLLDQATPSFSYLALGDSYTIGESVESSGRWPNQLIDSLEGQEIYLDSATIIAQTGWRTDELKAALATHDKFDYDLVSLLIGVNDQYQGKTAASYEPAFEELLSLAIERVGGDKERVFVLSIPNYGYTPFGVLNREGITTEIAEYNQINKSITNDKGIWYFEILLWWQQINCTHRHNNMHCGSPKSYVINYSLIHSDKFCSPKPFYSIT